MIRRGILGLLALLIGLHPRAAALPEDLQAPAVFPGDSKPTASRIAEARKRIDEGKLSEGVEELQQVLDAAGDDLTPVDAGRSVQARRLCHAVLASLPPAGLELYRQGAEPRAAKWLEQAKAERDSRWLRKIVDDAFCTRAGEEALNLLGDRAFERGDFDEAEIWWRLLLPPEPDARRAADPRYGYPDARQTPARVEAKLVLARMLRGRDAEFHATLQAYRDRHGKAEGKLAGRTGRFADILGAFAADNREPRATQWTTFGGDGTRGQIVAGTPRLLDRLGQICRDGPEWRFSLAERKKLTGTPLPLGTARRTADRVSRLMYHPLFVNGQVLVADTRTVTAYDVRSGQIEPWFDAARDGGGGNLRQVAGSDLRCTLTSAEGCLFARLGTQEINPGPDAAGRLASYLVCLRLKPTTKQRRLRWLAVPPPGAIFEGAPVAGGGLAHVAAIRAAGDRHVTSILTYPVDSTERPAPLWQVDVSESREPRRNEHRTRHHLLTLAGPCLVYCTHAGSVVAVEARNGRRLWATRYPSTGMQQRGDDAWPHDLAPCLFADGKIFVAPADSDRVLCLDPDTGRLLWERERTRVVHLLGVGAGRLIFATSRGLRAVSAQDGSDKEGWVVPETGLEPLRSVGRGFLVEDLVLWPTERGVVAIRQQDGLQPDNPTLLRNIPRGNLVWSEGCLAVAGAEDLSVFVPPAWRLDAKEKAAAIQPVTATLLRLARAELDAGRFHRALEHAQHAEKEVLGAAMRERCRELQHEALLSHLERAISGDEHADPEQLLRRASGEPFTPAARVRALSRAARWWQAAGKSAKARKAWQTILDTAELRGASASDPRGLPCSGAVLARRQLGNDVEHRRESGPAACPPRADRRGLLLRDWQAPLEEDWQLLVATDSDDSAGDLAIFSTPKGLGCRKAADGKECWQAALSFRASWVGTHNGLIVAGGESGAAGIAAVDGSLVWELPMVPSQGLSAFQLSAGKLFCLVNERRLLAVDAERGWPLWARWAPGGPFALPDGRFGSTFKAAGDRLLIQNAAGYAWLLDSASGRTIYDMPAPEAPWSGPPLILSGGRWCVVESATRIVARDGATGKEIWRHDIGGQTTLTGEPPLLAGGGDVLLMVSATNLGQEVQRLDVLDGKPRWPHSIRLPEARIDFADWGLDAAALYIARAGTLAAWSLRDGSALWETRLGGPHGAWRVWRQGDLVAACPAEGLVRRIGFHLLGGSLQWEGVALFRVKEFTPIVLCELRSGRMVQRLNFAEGVYRQSTTVGGVRFELKPRVRASTTLERAVPLAIQHHAGGLLVAGWRACWGLAAAENSP